MERWMNPATKQAASKSPKHCSRNIGTHNYIQFFPGKRFG